MPAPITLSTPLRLRTAFLFPLQSSLARREVLIGALLLLIPVIGWLLNMGHRIMMTHRMQHGHSAWPSWPTPTSTTAAEHPAPASNIPSSTWLSLLRHGTITFLGMVEYHAPSTVCFALARRYDTSWLNPLGIVLWLAATVAVPGYMSHYCRTLDPREVFNPFLALRRVAQGGLAYWHAWGIALAALGVSFTGLIAFGVGFLVTSVWFWQVAGFAFATTFTRRFSLLEMPHEK